jgi:predicted glutamine amidotransferase
MCGIVGIIQEDNKEYTLKKKVFNNLLFLDTVRGFDGTGLMYSENFVDHPDVFKKAIAAPDFMQLKTYDKIMCDIERYQYVFGHNRAATTGGVSHETSHPFQVGDITLIHNGTLTNRSGLPYKTVDSESIAAALDSEQDPIDVLKKLQGAYALVWHDVVNSCIYISKNDERPLHYADTEIGKVIASEKKMLECVLDRCDVEYKKGVKEFEVHRLYRFWTTKKGGLGYNSVKYEAKKREPTQTYNDYYSSKPQGGQGYKGSRENVSGSILKSIGLAHNQAVDLKVVGFEKYTSNSSYGRLVLSDEKNMHVRYSIHQIKGDEQEDFQDKRLSCRVTFASHLNEKGYTYNVNVDLRKPDVVYLPQVTRKDEVFQIPGSKEITQKEFYELVQNGCCLCNQNLFWQDRHKLEWLRSDLNQDEPVCPVCAQDLGINDYVGAHVN